MRRVHAPWTAEEVESLRRYQASDRYHEFTGPDGKVLLAYEDGWRSIPDGPIVQTWAWDFMLTIGAS